MSELSRSEPLIKHISEIMSKIHEDFPGKDSLKLRESLLKPYRDCCVVLSCITQGSRLIGGILGLFDINYPERTVYRDTYVETSKKVHVHRAPTDKSVALLKEMEQAALDRLVQSFRLDDCPIDCKVAAFEDVMNDSREYHLYFKINGKEYRTLYVYRHYKQLPHEKAIEVAGGCAQAMSDKISEVLLKGAFTKAFGRYYK